MDKIGKLTGILQRLNAGEDIAKVRQEAQQFLASIDATDLSFAEQKLMEAGLKPEDLRHLCSIHMEMLKDKAEELKKNLSPGHPVHTLICEHEEILGFLDELEKVNQNIQRMNSYKKGSKDFQKLAHIAKHLVEADAHHQREEDVIFPALEERGVFGPPQIMRQEHEDLRRYKKIISKLAIKPGQMNFKNFKKKLDSTSKLLVLTLRDHIFKENNILYPTAVQVIKDKGVWEKLREKCDKIGYCCFTPKIIGSSA